MTRFVMDPGAEDEILGSPEMLAFIQSVGDEVAENAQILAPKLTGAGAASIHAETEDEDGVPVAFIGWDGEHYYMRFAEEGTERQAPTPFLRPALEQTRV